jgi:hypothetical protein
VAGIRRFGVRTLEIGRDSPLIRTPSVRNAALVVDLDPSSVRVVCDELPVFGFPDRKARSPQAGNRRGQVVDIEPEAGAVDRTGAGRVADARIARVLGLVLDGLLPDPR